MSKEKIEAFIKNSGNDLTVFSKDAANDLLQNFEHQELFQVISNYMNAPDVKRREWIICIRTLCQIDKIKANKRFIDALQNDDPDKRFRIVKLLGGCGTEHIVPTLIKMLKEDSEPGIRVIVALTLGYIGDKRALSALEWSVENDDGADWDGNSLADVAKTSIERITKSI